MLLLFLVYYLNIRDFKYNRFKVIGRVSFLGGYKLNS